MIAALNIQRVNLSELNPAEYNPRKRLTPEDKEYHDIMKSLGTFSYVDPIISNKDGTIISGHQRLNVLLDMGYTEADIVVVDLNKHDEKALNIALNKIDGQWDEVKLGQLFVELTLGNYDTSITGFTEEEIQDVIELTEVEPEVVEDEFDEESAVEEAIQSESMIKRGEVWQLGRHRLMCGDSTVIADIEKLMDGEELDLIITDPPYNVNYEEKQAKLNEYRTNNNEAMPIENDVMEDNAFYEFLYRSFSNMKDVMRDGAAIYVFHSDVEGYNFRKAFITADLRLAECLIWEKNNFVLGRQDYHWRHEPILYGWKNGEHYFIDDRTQDTIILEDDVDFDSMKKPELIQYIKDMISKYADQTSVIFEKKPMSNDLHPTMKPVELIAKFMKNSSKKGWNVGDFFGGSGSTLITAEQLGRNAYLMELDENYASVIIKRWEEFTGQKATRIEV